MASYASQTFTPRARGRLYISVNFEAVAGGIDSDWTTSGNYGIIKPYIKQGGSYDYGPTQRLTDTRAKYSVEHTKNVDAGSAVEYGIEVSGGGLITVIAYYVNGYAFLSKETSS